MITRALLRASGANASAWGTTGSEDTAAAAEEEEEEEEGSEKPLTLTDVTAL